MEQFNSIILKISALKQEMDDLARMVKTLMDTKGVENENISPIRRVKEKQNVRYRPTPQGTGRYPPLKNTRRGTVLMRPLTIHIPSPM